MSVVIHTKTNSGRYGHIHQFCFFIGICVTWNDWDYGFSSVRLDHIAHASSSVGNNSETYFVLKIIEYMRFQYFLSR